MVDTDQEFKYRNNPVFGNRQQTDEKRSFAVRFSSAVKRLGINDSEVSRLSGIPRSAVSRYRNAESMPEARYVFRLAEILNVDPRWLITGEGAAPAHMAVGDGNPDAEQELLWHYRCIPVHHRNVVTDVAQALAEANALDLGNTRKSAKSVLRRQSPTLHSPTSDYRPEPKR